MMRNCSDVFTLWTGLVCLKAVTIILVSGSVIDKDVHVSLVLENLANQKDVTSEIYSTGKLSEGEEILANPIAVIFQVAVPKRSYRKSAVPLFARSLFNDVNYALARPPLGKSDKDPLTTHLSHLEFSMCGGRWRKEWGSGAMEPILYSLSQHVPCTSATISMCFNTNTSSVGGNFSLSRRRRVPKALHRAHESITKHLGAVLGTTSGLAEAQGLGNYDGIPFHIRPIQIQGGTDTKQCYIDEVLAEKLCTQNVHPIKEIFISPLIKRYVEENQKVVHSDTKDNLLHHIIPSFPLLLSTAFHSISMKLSLTEKPIDVQVAYVITTKYELNELRNHFRELDVKYSGKEVLQDIVRGSAVETIINSPKHLVPNVGDNHELSRRYDIGTLCTVGGHLHQRGEVRGTFYVKLECEIGSHYSNTTNTALVIDTLVVIPTRTIIPLLATMRRSECYLFGLKSSAKCDSESAVTTSTTLSLVQNEENGRDDKDLIFQLRNIIQTDKVMSRKDSGKIFYNISFDFNYPSLPNLAYPPDMHKGYVIPPLVTRIAEVIPLTMSQCTECEPMIGKEQISHQEALSVLLNPLPNALDNGERFIVNHITFQRSVASSTVTSLPLPDPAMVFNAVSLSSAVFSVCIGGVMAIIMRRRF